MDYSFSTIFTAIIASNIFIILITLCFGYKRVRLSLGFRLLAIFLVLTFLRSLLPGELPFTKTLYLPEAVSKYLYYFQKPFVKYGFFKLSPWILMQLAWFIGSLACLNKHLRRRRTLYSVLAMQGHEVTNREPYFSLVEELCRRRKNRFRAYTMPNLEIPFIFGITRPRIVLPESLALEGDDLRYILSHEMQHFFQGDLIIKELVCCFRIIYWWNPFGKRLQAQLSSVLEMRVDHALIKKHPEIEIPYLHTLIQLADSAVAKKNETLLPDNALYATDRKLEALWQRFEMVEHRRNKKDKLLGFALLILSIVLFIGSYAVVPEASYSREVANEEALHPVVDGFYLAPQDDGTYHFYYNGIFMEVIKNLDYYTDIPISENP